MKGATNMSDFQTIKEIIKNANSVVFFGGAGVSTESGIPDFRGTGGLYTEENETDPQEILTPEYMLYYPEKFYNYYKNSMLYPNAEPNDAHRVLSKMENDGKLTAVITQNIDGLHQKAGSENVIELHGTCLKNYCVNCGKNYDLNYILESDGVPYCEDCHGFVRPDVVMYHEGLNARKFYDAEEAIYYADVLIVGGTSLTVQPAASLIEHYQGEHLIIINRTPTPYDGVAEFVLRDSIAEVLSKIYD